VPKKKKKRASIAIITHVSDERKFKKLIFTLKKNRFVIKNPNFIRIENI